MNNLLLIDHSSSIGGGQRSLVEFLKHLQKHNLNIYAIIDTNNKELIDNLTRLDVKIFTVNFRTNILARAVVIFIVVSRLILKYRIKVIYANTFEAGFWAASLRLILPIQMVFRARLSIQVFNHGIIDWIIFRMSDLIFANSHFVKDGFLKRFGHRSAEKIYVIYNPLDVSLSHLSRRCAFPKADGYIVLAMIGRVQAVKKQMLAVKALEILKRRGKHQFRLIVIGGPDDSDNGKYFLELRDYLSSSTVKNDVKLVGHVSNPQVYFNEIDIVINCTVGEALSRVMFETQSYGIPNVATNSGGNLELIKHKITGLLFDVDSATSLASMIEELSANPQLYYQISKKARLQSMELFSLENTVEKEISVLKALYESSNR